jgi:gliding motility-associated-like protein
VCAGNSVQFTSNSTGYVASYAWTFPGGTPATSTAANPLVQYSTPGVYPVSLTVSNTAGSNQVTKADHITVSGVSAFAGPDQVVVAGDGVTLSGSVSPGAIAYQWSPAGTLTNPNSLLTRATPASTTVYTLTARNADNCEGSDNVTITVLPYCVDIKNAFSPNKDGINEHWTVTNGSCTEKVKAVVVNRYGQEMYRNENYTNNWDGTYKGKPVPDGTYYYVLTYHFIGGRIVTLKGDVTILR